MKMRLAVAVVTLVSLSAPAFALKLMQKVTPQWTKESGITVQTEKREDGSIGFTVTRYLDKARKFPADSELTIDRTAHLEIRNSRDSLAQTRVEGTVTKDSVVYWFSLSRDCVSHSRFSLSEYDDYKDTENKPHLIGGGTNYEFDLTEFAAPLLKAPLPAHP